MMKKIAALVGAGAMLLGTAVPAFAWWNWWTPTTSDTAVVTNSAQSVANTGNNLQGNGVDASWSFVGPVSVKGDNGVSTGNADADATAVVVANTHVECCSTPCSGGCMQMQSCPCPHNDYAVVTNSAYAGANTGYNLQGNGVTLKGVWGGGVTVGGDNSAWTGSATADSDAWTVVNTHWAN